MGVTGRFGIGGASTATWNTISGGGGRSEAGMVGGSGANGGPGGGRTDLDLYLQRKAIIMDILLQAIQEEHGD